MKKFYILLVCLLGTIPGFSQSRFFINLNGGLDFNSNKYYTPNGYEKFEDGKTDFNVGLDLGYRFSDKVRFRLVSGYNEYSFGQRNDALKSERNLYNLAFTPRLDFRVWSAKKLELFLSPGLRLEYVITSDGETWYTNGDYSKRDVYVKSDYRDKNSGFTGGAILKYNYSDHLGFTLSPDYTIFANKVYDKNSGTLQRFSMNLGVEWRF
jgi:hypothetical protein